MIYFVFAEFDRINSEDRDMTKGVYRSADIIC